MEKRWTTIGCPGYLGKHRDEKFAEWDTTYGAEKWRLVWVIGADELVGGKTIAYALYEDAYFQFLSTNQDVLDELISEAANVYDDQPSNILSGFDYFVQETDRTHLQDIAIRRSLVRMWLWFHGNRLIRIRQEKGDHRLSLILSPGRVPFHRPELIVQPEIDGKWWNLGSVEAFYQSNRVLQVLAN